MLMEGTHGLHKEEGGRLGRPYSGASELLGEDRAEGAIDQSQSGKGGEYVSEEAHIG